MSNTCLWENVSGARFRSETLSYANDTASSWDVILCFFWSSKLLEANKVGDVLTRHLNFKKAYSKHSECIIFRCWLSLHSMDFFPHAFLPWIPKRRSIPNNAQHYGVQGSVPWPAPSWGSQWRCTHTYFEARVCPGGSVPAFGTRGLRDLSWRSRRWHSCCPLFAKVIWCLLTANNIP